MNHLTLTLVALFLSLNMAPLVAQQDIAPTSRVVEIRSYNLKPGSVVLEMDDATVRGRR